MKQVRRPAITLPHDARSLDVRLREYAIGRIKTNHVMSQVEFGRQIHQNKTWVTRYLDPTKPTPQVDLETSVKIAVALNVSLRQLTRLEDLPAIDERLNRLDELLEVWAQIREDLREGALGALKVIAQSTLAPKG